MPSSRADETNFLREAESYPGTSLVMAYSQCIAHGVDMRMGMEQQKAAVQSGHWPLFRFDPRLAAEGKNPFQLDSKAPAIPLKEYIYNETRYKMLALSAPDVAETLLRSAQEDVASRWRLYEHLASMRGDADIAAAASEAVHAE